VDHTYLFTPEVRWVRDLIARGELGPLYYLDSVRINLGLFQRDHDVVWDLAPHDLSIFSCWLGRAPRSVLAVGSSHTPSGLADVAFIHLDYGEQLHAHVHVNWLSPVKVRRTLVAGQRRMVHYNELQGGERVQLYDCGIELPDLERQRQALVDYRKGDMLAPFIPAREALAIEAEEVVACLEGRATPTSPGTLGLEVVRTLEALSRSMAAGGQRVELGAS
jgi:predicted dehydrogenase